jgi:hypothetical protein
MLQPGQKVICIHESPLPPHLGPFPKKGSVYVIAEVWTAHGLDTVQLEGLRFDGCVWQGNVWAPGFWAGAFRPIVDRPTDISIFKAMLNPTSETVSA